MNIESIIGITASIITIATAIGIKFDVLNLFSKPNAKELFGQLLNKDITDAKRRKILKKLNKSSLFNNRIKDDYIMNFALRNRGKEKVLFEIFNCNNIEPNDDICKEFLNASMPSWKKAYQEKKRNIMSTSNQRNTVSTLSKSTDCVEKPTVYMSELLKIKYPETCGRLIQILEKHNISFSFLKGTKDIWCRDYMPIQTASGRFVQFKYDPSYLKGNKEWEDSRTDAQDVLKANNIDIEVIPSEINLDGGNVLICDDRAIISDRIFSENPNMNQERLLDELGKLLECEIIIIPSHRSIYDDFTGHADGMVRFVNRNIILGNKLADEYQYIQKGMQKVIEQYNLKYIDIPFFIPQDKKHPDSAIGVYVNFLEVENLIVLPVFGRDEDKEVFNIIKGAFPDRDIETINYNDVAQEGGLINCTTWVANVSSTNHNNAL